jgi:hypothetical protein
MYIKSALLLMILIISILSCKSDPPPPPIVIREDPLVLQEVSPLPRVVVAAIQKVVEYEPIYATFRIIELSEENGVQKYFLVRMGDDRTGIEIGASESIAEDEAFEKIIGKYKIIEITGNFFRGEILELDYKIGATAFVRVKIGEKLKEKDV